ncbi:MAG: bifunctional nuclease family protein [Candidatus Yanofskybacteria bacterium]|nr:bifunctional nuclease family protein [Candidatus Yanofskybacteria bacterium]
MWGYVIVAVIIGIFLLIMYDSHMHPICPIGLFRFNSRRLSFFNNKAVCLVHGPFIVNKRSKCKDLKTEKQRELIVDSESIIYIKKVSENQIRFHYFILPRDKTTNSTFPITIGVFEYAEIFNVLKNLPFPRPLTHDFFKNMLTDHQITVSKVVITKIVDGIYYTDVYSEQGGDKVITDARPSNAIALALRFGSPIFIEDALLTEILADENAMQMIDFIEKNKPSILELQKLGDSQNDLQDDPGD